MAKYELREFGVYDREADVEIHPFTGGEQWAAYLEWLSQHNVPDPMPPKQVPTLTLEQVVAERIMQVEQKAAELRQKVTYPASVYEMASWTVKFQQALAFQSGNDPATAPMLVEEAAARGVTTADIASRVLANASAYTKAEARIAGVCGKHKDALRALATVGEVLLYDISVSWDADQDMEVRPTPIAITAGAVRFGPTITP